MRLRSDSVKTAANVILDIIAALLVLAALIPILYICIVASIFLGVEWYEWLLLGLVAAFVAWRVGRYI